jgi:hypothetical protein
MTNQIEACRENANGTHKFVPRGKVLVCLHCGLAQPGWATWLLDADIKRRLLPRTIVRVRDFGPRS